MAWLTVERGRLMERASAVMDEPRRQRQVFTSSANLSCVLLIIRVNNVWLTFVNMLIFQHGVNS